MKSITCSNTSQESRIETDQIQSNSTKCKSILRFSAIQSNPSWVKPMSFKCSSNSISENMASHDPRYYIIFCSCPLRGKQKRNLTKKFLSLDHDTLHFPHESILYRWLHSLFLYSSVLYSPFYWFMWLLLDDLCHPILSYLIYCS